MVEENIPILCTCIYCIISTETIPLKEEIERLKKRIEELERVKHDHPFSPTPTIPVPKWPFPKPSYPWKDPSRGPWRHFPEITFDTKIDSGNSRKMATISG
jgi:hypothetical protein